MDETIITPGAEVNAPQEGSVEAAIIEETHNETKTPDTVPLSVYLELKDDFKALKKEIKEASKSNQEKIEARGFSELTQKYPDVSPEFIQDMLSSATKEATKKIEEKYSPIIEKQEMEKKQAEFDRAFDNLFEKTLQENPDLPSTIDKELVKELALTPKYRNVPLSEILIKMYASSQTGKASSENDMRSSSDRISDVVDFGNINDEQKKAIMADPKVRQKYFDYLDTQTGR